MWGQIAVNGLSYGSTLALLGLAFSITYMGCRFFTFAFGASYVAAAYVVLALHQSYSLLVCMIVGVLVAAALAAALETLCFGPLRARNDNPMILMIASIGIYTVVENLISLQFGDDTRSFRTGLSSMLSFGAISLSLTQLYIVVVSAILVAAVHVFLRYNVYGTALRALSSNAALAMIAGLELKRITIVAVTLGGALAGVASCLQALDTDIVPTMGFWALTYGIIASVVAGPRRPTLAALSGLGIGLVSNLAVAWIPSKWQDAIAFMILAVVLYVRTRPGQDAISKLA
jgi:branched-chain amino acid transport system permease protein